MNNPVTKFIAKTDMNPPISKTKTATTTNMERASNKIKLSSMAENVTTRNPYQPVHKL